MKRAVSESAPNSVAMLGSGNARIAVSARVQAQICRATLSDTGTRRLPKARGNAVAGRGCFLLVAYC